MIRHAWLSLGANIGDPSAQLEDAVRRLHAHPDIEVVARSRIISTKPWGKTDQPDFANMAVTVQTSLEPVDLLHAALDIERSMGRVRHVTWGPRLIDIDIIAYERLEMHTGTLTLPHPHAHERDFVLVPLLEIAPETADWVITRVARSNG